MAKQILPVNYKDDVLSTSMGRNRKYNIIYNDDGTVSFDDVTEYTQVGDNYGAAQLNATNQAVNESVDKATIIDSLDDIAANTQSGMVAGALAVLEMLKSSFKCELTQLTTKSFRAGTKATAMHLDEQYNYSDFKMIGFCVINMSTSDSVSHRQWQWIPTKWLQDNLLNQDSSSSYSNRRLVFNFSRSGGDQRAWIYGSTTDGLNFTKGSSDKDNYDCVIFGLS